MERSGRRRGDHLHELPSLTRSFVLFTSFQIFVRYEDSRRPELGRHTVVGSVVVARAPALHPGGLFFSLESSSIVSLTVSLSQVT